MGGEKMQESKYEPEIKHWEFKIKDDDGCQDETIKRLLRSYAEFRKNDSAESDKTLNLYCAGVHNKLMISGLVMQALPGENIPIRVDVKNFRKIEGLVPPTNSLGEVYGEVDICAYRNSFFEVETNDGNNYYCHADNMRIDQVIKICEII